jgi:antitoxin component YwqK of YwqJK toxin-antitoxin module
MIFRIQIFVFLNLVLSCGNCDAQTNDSVIYFKPVFVNQCSGEVESNEFYYIIKDNKYIKGAEPEDSEVLLPSNGKYTLRHFEYGDFEFEINNQGIYIDTFLIPKLVVFNVVGDAESQYIYCDSLADGYIEGFFKNGQIRVKGSFMNGHPIDTLFTYYDSGILCRLEIIDTINGIKMMTFYENAQLKEYRNNQEFKTTKFYETGELKEITDWRGDLYKTPAYYKNGELLYTDIKGKDFVYHNNGVIKYKLYKKEIYKIDRILHPKDYPYYSDRFFETTWLSFDEKGVLTRKIIFDDFQFYFDYDKKDNLTQIEVDNIETVIFYKNGEKYKIIEYDYTEKAHFLYEYNGRNKVLISKVKNIRMMNLINQIDKEIDEY